ncbi:hypothetical protein QQ008_12610 [Fulvivirgaceae bacterium BMA10]|uniref:Uncharacterized protein n=1 Tax=Splendidivirga corallicola TaxID=3051826 RepID=A0ABT8KRC5_9BACT|nr:hypothetical protein [Fulvivirgaceae bacterium BMA10]
METASQSHEMKIVNGDILYFRFIKGNKVEAYSVGLQQCKDNMVKPEVTKIVVVVEDEDTMFSSDMQDIWLMTGELADANGLDKWGVVVPSLEKEITIRYLVNGGKDGVRNYDSFISDDETEVMEWAAS